MPTPQMKQKHRLLELKTPLGVDALVINGLSGSEAVSGLFRLKLELLAPVAKPQPVKNLLGKGISVSMDGGRPFHGMVNRISTGPRDKSFQHYSAEVVPWLWLLTQRAGCRIFQDMTVPEIIKKIFSEYKGPYSDVVAFDDLTKAHHIPLDYCVQYRETDFNFVSRLMEQDGIFYFFDPAGSTMFFADSNTVVNSIHGNPSVLYEAEGGYGNRGDVIHHFDGEYELRPAKYTLRDHHFELPGQSLEVTEGGEGLLEIYDYPGEYALRFNEPEKRIDKVSQEGEKLVGLRIQEEELSHLVFEGTSTCRNFACGHKFKLKKHFMSDDEYIITSVNYSVGQNPDYLSGSEAAATPYHNSFVCVKASVPIRPKRLTPKPVVAGPQTATVTVKSGEESWLDKYGRVRAQFHWDREGKKNEASTCWIRVAQSWAGGGWGAHFWPRLGQEVVVEFLEGDPDRPLVTGSVYNKANMPPYELPANYTRSGFITRSSKNGSSDNFNEIRFEDKKGSEQVFINAEKDEDHRVENDMREWVGNNQHLIVKASQNQTIEGNKHEHIKAEHLEAVDGDASRSVQGDFLEKISGDSSLAIEGDHKEKIGGKLSLQVGKEHHEKVGQLYVVDTGQEIHLKAGMKVIIESGMQISLKGPGGFVDIGPTGVTIQGTMVMINSGGSAGSGSSASPDAPKDPKEPKEPQIADDGSEGGALG